METDLIDMGTGQAGERVYQSCRVVGTFGSSGTSGRF
jgi:hypothetical protein